MQKVRVPISSFQFGEVNPSLLSRTDSAVYTNSGQRVENFLIRSEGGVKKRGGFQNIGALSNITYDASKTVQARALPFIFSDDEEYIVVLQDARVVVYQISPTTGAVSLATTLTLDVDSAVLPFDEDYLHEYTYAQSGDVMFICHPLFMPRLIRRTGGTTFEVDTFSFLQRADDSYTFQPYYTFQAAGTTLSSSLTTGTGSTLTTSNDFFVDAHVGTRLRYHDAEILITAVASATSATGDIVKTLVQELIFNALRSADGSDILNVTHINHGFLDGDSIAIENASAFAGLSSANINGTYTIEDIIDENTYTIDSGHTATAGVDGGGYVRIITGAATLSWAEQSISPHRGYPAAVTFHENRFVLAGTPSQPDSIWMSNSAQYFKFDEGDADASDSVHLTAATNEVNQIRHLLSNRDLQVFAATGEMLVSTLQRGPLTPTNVKIAKQTPFGCNYASPSQLDGGTVFIQYNGVIAREFLYSDSEAAYTSQAISSLAPHLIKKPHDIGVLQGAINQSESYIFTINDDGTISVFNSNRAEQRAAWTEFTSLISFKSIAVVDDRVFATGTFVDGDGASSYVLVEVTAESNLDVSRIYSGTAGVFDVSADFQDGITLSVVSGTNYYGDVVVSGGEVDVSGIDATLASAEIGLKFGVNLTTNPIDVRLSAGPLTGLPRTIGSVIADVVDTLSMEVNGTRLIIRTTTSDLSAERTAVSGKKEFRLLGYNRDPQVIITQPEPLSLQVNGLIAEVSF
jgi:hypothetical protein